MKKRNAFTLVELLAVIVILGIVLIIAVPGVLGIIKNARKAAWVQGANVLLSTMKTDHQANGVKQKTEYSIKDNKIVRKESSQVPSGIVSFDGKYEKIGEVTIDEKGKTVAAFSNDLWCASKTVKDTKLKVTDGKCDLSIFDETPPVIDQFISTSQTTNSITVSMSCHDDETRIVGYEYSKDGGKNYEPRVEDSVYTFKKLKSGSYQLKGRCINKAELSATSEVIEKSTIEVNAPTYSVTPTGDVWAPKKKLTITYPERKDGFVYEYSIDSGTTWIEVPSGTTKDIEFTTNGSVIARIYDGTNYKAASSYSIGKVDPTGPIGVSVSIGAKTTNSIQVIASGSDDESGIKKYEFSIDGKSYEDNGNNNIYTFTKVSSGNHKIKVRVTNGSGLKVESSEISVDPNELTLPVYKVTPSGDVWAAKKTVTITYPTRETGFVYEYSLDGGSNWINVPSGTTKDIDFTSNGSVIARINDGTNYKNGSSYSVGKVDPTEPTGVSATIGTRTSSTIEVTANGIDSESGITKYEFSIDGRNYINNGANNVYTFTKVTSGNHTIKVRVTNGSGMSVESGETPTAPTDITTPLYTITPSGDVWAPSKTVTITYPVRETNFVYEYSLNGGSSWTTVSNGTSVNIPFANNGFVIARVFDGTNYKNGSSYSVGKVDSTPPINVSIGIGTKTTNSIQVIASGSDPESGITKYEFSIDGGSYINNGTNNIYAFTKLTSGSHAIKARLTNGSGLQTETSTSVSTNEITAPTYSVTPSGDIWAAKKTVTITYPPRETDFVYEYSLNGGSSWINVPSGTTKNIDFTSNGTVIARVFDGTNYKNGSSYSVGKIDLTGPTGVSATIGTRTSNTIQVTANGSDSESGITKYEFSIDGGNYTNNGANKVYTFTKVSSGNHTIKVRVTNGSGMSVESGETPTAPTDITTPLYTITPSGDVWAPSKTVTITYPARETDFVYEYSLNGGTIWTTVSSGTTVNVPFTSNGSVIARVFDGTNYKNGSSYSVGKVDSTPPTGVSIGIGTKTTNSIQVIASGSDPESGITKYEFSKDGGSYVSNGTNNTYNFTGLTSGSHIIKVRLTNGSGLQTEVSTSTAPTDITTPLYTITPSGDVWATSKTVTITYPTRETGFVYQYSTNGGSSWITVSSGTSVSIPFSNNGNVIARIFDGTNYKNGSAYSVGKVDSTAPTEVSIGIGAKTTNSIQVIMSGSDPESGITKYEFSKDGGSYVSNGTNNTYNFTGLKTGNHTIRVRVTNGVGLQMETGVLVAPNVILTPTYSISPSASDWAASKTVTITYQTRETGLVYQYSINGGSTWTTVSSGTTASVSFSALGSVIARIHDGLNYVTASSYTVTNVGNEGCFKFDKASGTITGYNELCPKNVVIPSQIGGVSVIEIGDSAFNSKQLTSVVIPNNVTKIREGAFKDNQLTSVTIPDSITVIEAGIFKNNQLTSVTIPNSVKSIGSSAFENNQLTRVTIPNSVTAIGIQAFMKNQLTSVVIPNSVTSIGKYGFAFNQLTNVVIPNSVLYISEAAFQNNKLTSVTIPNSIKQISSYTFMGNQLTSVVIPNSVTEIGYYSFSSNQLTTVTIPKSVTRISSVAFGFNPLSTIIIQGKTALSEFTTLESSWYDGKPTIIFQP